MGDKSWHWVLPPFFAMLFFTGFFLRHAVGDARSVDKDRELEECRAGARDLARHLGIEKRIVSQDIDDEATCRRELNAALSAFEAFCDRPDGGAP